MTGSRPLLRRALLGLAAALAAAAACAGPGELTVVSDPSMKGVLTAAARQFEQETGQHVGLLFVKPNQLSAAIKGQDHPDLAILPEDLMDKVIQSRQAQPDTRKPLGQVGVAVVVKSGAARPDVSSPEALKQVLGGAKSIVYAEPGDNPAGRQAAQVIAHLGLTEGLKERTTLAAGANPLAQVSLGAVEIGLHAMHEALESSGVTVLGPVPASLQPWTRYAIAMTSDAPNASEARRLMEFLAGSAGRSLLQQKGVSPSP